VRTCPIISHKNPIFKSVMVDHLFSSIGDVRASIRDGSFHTKHGLGLHLNMMRLHLGLRTLEEEQEEKNGLREPMTVYLKTLEVEKAIGQQQWDDDEKSRDLTTRMRIAWSRVFPEPLEDYLLEQYFERCEYFERLWRSSCCKLPPAQDLTILQARGSGVVRSRID